MGVPVVTCPGATFAGRHSLSHLSNVGLTETVARDLDEYVATGLRAGASGFLLMDTPPQRLLAAIHSVAAGEMLFAPSITRRLVDAYVAVKTHLRCALVGGQDQFLVCLAGVEEFVCLCGVVHGKEALGAQPEFARCEQ